MTNNFSVIFWNGEVLMSFEKIKWFELNIDIVDDKQVIACVGGYRCESGILLNRCLMSEGL